jgi:hypothetical protein
MIFFVPWGDPPTDAVGPVSDTIADTDFVGLAASQRGRRRFDAYGRETVSWSASSPGGETDGHLDPTATTSGERNPNSSCTRTLLPR